MFVTFCTAPQLEVSDIVTQQTNASIIRDIFTEVAQTCPKAICCVVTNPVNSTVAVAAEALRAQGAFDARRLFGVTTLDVIGFDVHNPGFENQCRS